MFPPLSEPQLKPALLDRRVPGAKGISGVERLCHRKLSWRRDVLILSYRNVGSVAEMRAKNEGWQVSAKALGESVHQDHPADKLVRRDRHGFPAVRTFDAIVLPAERHAPIIGCDQPAVRDGNGLHLAWGANFLRSLLQRGRQELAQGFTCRGAAICRESEGAGHAKQLLEPLVVRVRIPAKPASIPT